MCGCAGTIGREPKWLVLGVGLSCRRGGGATTAAGPPEWQVDFDPRVEGHGSLSAALATGQLPVLLTLLTHIWKEGAKNHALVRDGSRKISGLQGGLLRRQQVRSLVSR